MWFRVYKGETPKVGDKILFTVFIASTMTSTIPGVSIAGSSPEATLYTPALDVEYLVYGRPLTLNVIPVTPDGLPTPALLTRVAVELLQMPVLVVDAGSHVKPLIPHVKLPSSTPGDRINSGKALPEGYATKFFHESMLLGKSLAKDMYIVVGESMPGGTTTALAIMEALGFKAKYKVSSASPVNPHELKVRLVEEGLMKSRLKIPADDVFKAVEAVGDPLHISIAGFVAGALSSNSKVIMAGGTQMCSVLAILKNLGYKLNNVTVATTRWIMEDRHADMMGLVSEIAPEISLIASQVDFRDSEYKGLRAYEEGYVKEGVGAGGLMTLLALKGFNIRDFKLEVHKEYVRLLNLGYTVQNRTHGKGESSSH